jgi:hypothetical protein
MNGFFGGSLFRDFFEVSDWITVLLLEFLEISDAFEMFLPIPSVFAI